MVDGCRRNRNEDKRIIKQLVYDTSPMVFTVPMSGWGLRGSLFVQRQSRIARVRPGWLQKRADLQVIRCLVIGCFIACRTVQRYDPALYEQICDNCCAPSVAWLHMGLRTGHCYGRFEIGEPDNSGLLPKC